MKVWRNVLVTVGVLTMYVANILWLPLVIPGLVMVLVGCYLWTKLKNRSWAFALFGILAPIGYIPLAMLKDKTVVPIPVPDNTLS